MSLVNSEGINVTYKGWFLFVLVLFQELTVSDIFHRSQTEQGHKSTLTDLAQHQFSTNKSNIPLGMAVSEPDIYLVGSTGGGLAIVDRL